MHRSCFLLVRLVMWPDQNANIWWGIWLMAHIYASIELCLISMPAISRSLFFEVRAFNATWSMIQSARDLLIQFYIFSFDWSPLRTNAPVIVTNRSLFIDKEKCTSNKFYIHFAKLDWSILVVLLLSPSFLFLPQLKECYLPFSFLLSFLKPLILSQPIIYRNLSLCLLLHLIEPKRLCTD